MTDQDPIDALDEFLDRAAEFFRGPIIGTCACCKQPAETDGITLPCGCVYCGICAGRGHDADHPTDCAGPDRPW